VKRPKKFFEQARIATDKPNIPLTIRQIQTFATMRSFKDDGPDETHPLFWRRYLKIGTANSQVGAELDGT
jgi:hypothetical protein